MNSIESSIIIMFICYVALPQDQCSGIITLNWKRDHKVKTEKAKPLIEKTCCTSK